MQKSAHSWRDWVCLFSVLPSHCPVSPTVSLSLCLFTDTNAYSTCLPCLSSGCPISLSALLSLQLGTCTIILTSRGLLPAPNTLLPSVSLVVSSPVSRTRGLTSTTVCLSWCQYDGLLCCALKTAVPLSTPPCGYAQICARNHSVLYVSSDFPRHTVVLNLTDLS